MKLEGAKNRAFSMEVWTWIEILKSEQLSISGETALSLLEGKMEQIAQMFNIYKNTLDAANWLIENLIDMREGVRARNYDESLLAYKTNRKILNNYERNETNVKDSQAGS